MRTYDNFMEKVKEANPDEFPELNDIVARYYQLKDKATELENQTKEYENETEMYTAKMLEKEKEAKQEQL